MEPVGGEQCGGASRSRLHESAQIARNAVESDGAVVDHREWLSVLKSPSEPKVIQKRRHSWLHMQATYLVTCHDGII